MDKETKKYLSEQFARMATKDDLAILRTEIIDVAGSVNALATHTDKRFSELSAEITDVAESVNALATHVDKRFDDLAPFTRDVQTHEKRIRFLEDKLPRLAH